MLCTRSMPPGVVMSTGRSVSQSIRLLPLPISGDENIILPMLVIILDRGKDIVCVEICVNELCDDQQQGSELARFEYLFAQSR